MEAERSCCLCHTQKQHPSGFLWVTFSSCEKLVRLQRKKDTQELLREQKVFWKYFSSAKWLLCVGWSQGQLSLQKGNGRHLFFFFFVDSGCFPDVGKRWWVYLIEGCATSVLLITLKGILCVHCVQRQDP